MEYIIICNTSTINCLVPVRRFPSPSQSIRLGDVSEANGWGTPRQKQNAHVCVAFFKMADFVELFKMLQTAGSYGFKTLVNACDIVYRILPTLKSQQHIIYSPFDD